MGLILPLVYKPRQYLDTCTETHMQEFAWGSLSAPQS